MSQVAILGSSLEALQKAHEILDKNPSKDITIYTEDAEVGFPDSETFEKINVSSALKTMPDEWVGFIPKVVGNGGESVVAHSWLCKAMVIRLAERGVRLQLRTTIISIDEEEKGISFRGAGKVSSGMTFFDELHDYR